MIRWPKTARNSNLAVVTVMATIFRHTNNAWKCAKAFECESKKNSEAPVDFMIVIMMMTTTILTNDHGKRYI